MAASDQLGHWLAVVAEHVYQEHRLYSFESVMISDHAAELRAGDMVALAVAGEPPALFGLGRVSAHDADLVSVAYTHRLFDESLPLEAGPPGLYPLSAVDYRHLTKRVGAHQRVDADRRPWLVSLALPIEATTPAEAVREFWSYVVSLGPRELPAFVWPRGNELAMQAYVVGEPTDLDPEQDD